MGVEKRLLDDAASFAEEVTTLDEDGFISRTLAALGLADDSVRVKETKEATARTGRSQRPALDSARL